MPSVETIRSIKIQGSATGVNETTAALDRLTASIAAANDNLAKSRAAANENSEGFRITGEGALTAANHMRQAAEAAYVFSPAFRNVVNEMAAPALKAAHVSLEAVATGLVLATNTAGTGLIKLSAAAASVSPAFGPLSGAIKSAGVAMEAFNPTLGGVASSILTKLLPALGLLGKGLLIYDAIKMVGQAWELGNAKLAEYVALSEKAAALNTTTDFFQRITKAAEDAKLPIDALTEALKKMNDATAGKLGGSAANNAIDKLREYGNFKGNGGVDQLKNANGAEEKLRALVDLYDKAVAKGERLAALEVIRATLGETIAQKAEKDSGYLDKMLASADAINKTDLVKSSDIQNAVELQNRYDAAVKILETRWHPIQDLLTAGGIKMKQAWVSVVEAIASGVDALSKLLEKLASVPKWFQDSLNKLGNWAVGATTTVESRMAAEKQRGISSDPTEMAATALNNRIDEVRGSDAMADARKRLAEAMHRQFDTSKPPPPTDRITPDTGAYDRATESILKYIKVTEAASKSVSDAASEQERLKVIAQLTAAAEKDGTPITAELSKKMEDLATRAGAAADALAKARVANQIDFDRKTAFLSQEDVSIAQQLKGIYGNEIPAALNSTYAAGIRANNAFKQIGSALEGSLSTGLADILDGTKSVGQGFSDMSKIVVRAIEEMVIKMMIVQPLMRALQSGLGGITGGLFGGGSATAGMDGLAAIHHTGGIAGDSSMPTRYIHPAYFDNAPRFHTGGIAGDEVPIIAKRGEGVFTEGQMAAMGGGSKAPQFTVNIVEDSSRAGQTQQKSNDNGGFDFTAFVDSVTAKNAANPGSATSRVLNQRGQLVRRGG